MFYKIKKTRDYMVIGEDLDYKITVDHGEKEVVILFEETDSPEDWNNNYLIFPWPVNLDGKLVWTTYGYAKIYKSARDVPLDEFCELLDEYPDYKVVKKRSSHSRRFSSGSNLFFSCKVMSASSQAYS